MDIDSAKIILEKNIKDYDAIAEKYAQVREKNWQEMGFLFDDYIRQNDNVLDLGCGNGRFYEDIKSRGADYWGVDPSEKLIEIAKHNYPEADFLVAQAFDLPFESDFFDIVYSIAVLHHIPGTDLRQQFLLEARRALKRDGYLMLTVWDLTEKIRKRKFDFFNWIWERYLEKNDYLLPWYGTKDTYFHRFDLTELINLFESVGLKIIKKGEILVGEKPYKNLYIIAQKI
jgi:SAM-dependent methyltransferase